MNAGDSLLRRLLPLLLLLAAVQAALNASELPALSAAWFGLDGAAYWYVETWQLMWLHVGVAAALTAGFWVLPERLLPPDDGAAVGGARGTGRAGTHALRRWTWFGIVTLIALAALAQLVYDANRRTIPTIAWRSVLALGAGYAAWVGAWLWLGRRARG